MKTPAKKPAAKPVMGESRSNLEWEKLQKQIADLRLDNDRQYSVITVLREKVARKDNAIVRLSQMLADTDGDLEARKDRGREFPF